MSMRYFECSDGTSNKFWEIRTEIPQCLNTMRSGTIGTRGRQSYKNFDDAHSMYMQAEKFIAEKLRKGYVEKDMFIRAMASLVAASESIALFEEARRLNRRVPWALTTLTTQFPNLERGGLAWKFLIDEVPYKEVDRRKSMIKGPFFITEEYPVPRAYDDKLMVPMIQVDLRELSKLSRLPLGDGLLQAWWTWTDNECRVIPRQVVDERDSSPFPMDINAFPVGESCYLEDWMSTKSFGGTTRDDNERLVPVILGYCDPFISIRVDLESSSWDEIVTACVDGTKVSEPADYARLIEVVKKLYSDQPSCDYVFGSPQSQYNDTPDGVQEDVLFYFGDEYFGGFGARGCEQIEFGFKDGKPFYCFRSPQCFRSPKVQKIDSPEVAPSLTAETEAIDFSGQGSLGSCPKCGNHVYEHGLSYVCEKSVGSVKSCDFRSGNIVLQQEISRTEMQKLLGSGKTSLLTGFVSRRTQRKFSAYLACDSTTGKIGLEFESPAKKR